MQPTLFLLSILSFVLPSLASSHRQHSSFHNKRDDCVNISLKGKPVLANATDGLGFIGYVTTQKSGDTRLSAVAITNQTTNETFYLIPSCSGKTSCPRKTFSIITPDGLIFKLNRNLTVKNPPRHVCSLPTPPTKRSVEGDRFGLEKRQGLDLVGGVFVSFDAKQCGNPATGLAPSRLKLTCDLPSFHYLGFSWDNMPLYRNDPLTESAPGRYSGWCPFPEATDLSQQPMCTTGREAIKPICQILNPAGGLPVPPGSPVIPKFAVDTACAPIFLIPEVGVVFNRICKAALTAAVGFCSVAGNSKVQEALCSPPPDEIDIDIRVLDQETNEEIRTHMSILPTGLPRPLSLPQFTGSSAGCESVTPTATPTPTPPASTPPGPSPTSDNPARDPLCKPNTLNSGFEGGYPDHPPNGWYGYNFKGGRWGIDCYQSRGFAPVDGHCYAYANPGLAQPIGTPFASYTDNGVFHNIGLDASCVGQSYTLTVSVRRQPGIDADCGVQILLGHDGFHGTDDLENSAIYYGISTENWQTLTYSFEAANPASATNPELNFFCTRVGDQGAPWFAFDAWVVS